MTAQRALNCIPEVGDGTLRATQPAALNDPFECAVETLYVFADKAEEDRELAKVLTEINENKPISAKEVCTARIEYGSLFTRQLLSEQFSTRFGIVSLTTNPFHPLMWSLYTTDGSGFVIGYDMSELKKLGGPDDALRAVQYNGRPPGIIGPVVFSQPRSNIPIFLSLKSNHWSHEEEWRLIVELNKTVGTGQKDQHDLPINLVQIPNEAVVEVFYIRPGRNPWPESGVAGATPRAPDALPDPGSGRSWTAAHGAASPGPSGPNPDAEIQPYRPKTV